MRMMTHATDFWQTMAPLLIGALGALRSGRGRRSAKGSVVRAAASSGPVRSSYYIEINAANANMDVPTGLGAGQLWTDFHIATTYQSFAQCTFKNGGATILVATAFAPNYDADGHFDTPVVLTGPLTINCPGAYARVFVSGYK
jgi:hypothetical protein